MTEQDFEPHEVAWTRAKARRFWDHEHPGNEARSFAAEVGDAVIDLTRRHLPLRGKSVLDYGAGAGIFCEKLVACGAALHAADFSTASVESIRKRAAAAWPLFSGVTLLGALPSPLPGAAYDVAFFLETLEHLLPGESEAVLGELHRVLKPGGSLVITVPNEEDLPRYKVLCPDCGGRFHPVQHQTSWSVASLGELLRTHGFRPAYLRALTFRPGSRYFEFFDLLYSLVGAPKLNLFCIAKKMAP